MDIQTIKERMLGNWSSIAPELRPSTLKNPDGSLKPFYLSRKFSYYTDDRFTLEIRNFADPYGAVPITQMRLSGTIHWQGQHPVAVDAYKVQFVADEEYVVTPLNPQFTELLNKIAGAGFSEWKLNEPQSILQKAFAPFGLSAGQIFSEYDLIFILNDFLFWGARNIDGRGFDTEENRPTNLQIPLVRVK